MRGDLPVALDDSEEDVVNEYFDLGHAVRVAHDGDLVERVELLGVLRPFLGHRGLLVVVLAVVERLLVELHLQPHSQVHADTVKAFRLDNDCIEYPTVLPGVEVPEVVE